MDRVADPQEGPPFSTHVLATKANTADKSEANVDDPSASQIVQDEWPASYHFSERHGRKESRLVGDPSEDVSAFLKTELSLDQLESMEKHLWFAGSKRPAMQLHFEIVMGRQIVVADRMDMHLLWDNKGRIFLKPIPRFLLNPNVWESNLKCKNGSACGSCGVPVNDKKPADECVGDLRKVALGFLYTYVCLVCSEADFFLANENRLFPRKEDDSTIKWEDWKTLARELINHLHVDKEKKIHPRFLRAELRLTRINTIHRFTQKSILDPYLRRWNNYGDLFRDNLSWITAATVFVALVLTAMQVGLATERLSQDVGFQRASYGFTVFAILGPICAFGLVILAALINLLRDVPTLLTDMLHSRSAEKKGNSDAEAQQTTSV